MKSISILIFTLFSFTMAADTLHWEEFDLAQGNRETNWVPSGNTYPEVGRLYFDGKRNWFKVTDENYRTAPQEFTFSIKVNEAHVSVSNEAQLWYWPGVGNASLSFKNSVTTFSIDYADGSQMILQKNSRITSTRYLRITISYNNNGNCVMYWDMNAVASATATGKSYGGTNQPTEICIGHKPGDDMWFNGKVDEFIVYEEALTYNELMIEWGQITVTKSRSMTVDRHDLKVSGMFNIQGRRIRQTYIPQPMVSRGGINVRKACDKTVSQ